MNKFYKKCLLAMLSAFVIVTVSCSDDTNDNKPEPSTKKKTILIETTVTNPNGDSGSSYIQLVPKLSGTIDNSNAIQIEYLSAMKVNGNDIFVFPFEGPILKKYTYVDGSSSLGKAKTLQLSTGKGVGTFSIGNISKEKAYIPSVYLPKVFIINPKTMKKTGEIDLTSHAYKDGNPDAGYGFVRDGYYFLPLGQFDSNWKVYKDYRQTDVLVIDASTNQVVKKISETKTGLCFPTRQLSAQTIFTDEKKDLYITCLGYSGQNPNYKKSGFVCIPAGKTEFDTSKSWDISNTIIEGVKEKYKPSGVVGTAYMGNGKVAAYVDITELKEKNEGKQSHSIMAVVMDLYKKTIKKINGIPLTADHAVYIKTHNGEAVFAVDGKSKQGLFTYNPNTGSAKQNATTVGHPDFLHFFK